MPASSLEVRRLSLPTVDIFLKDRNGLTVNVTGYAFRFSAMDDQVIPFRELFEIIPTIVAAAAGQIRVAFTAAQTGFLPGSYRAELRWRTDGVAPTSSTPPHDTIEYSFRIVEAAEALP